MADVGSGASNSLCKCRPEGIYNVALQRASTQSVHGLYIQNDQ